MERRNITISVPKALLKKVKIMATLKDKPLNGLFIEAIEEMVWKYERYNTARKRQLRLLKTGLNLGTKGRLATSREEMHDRG